MPFATLDMPDLPQHPDFTRRVDRAGDSPVVTLVLVKCISAICEDKNKRLQELNCDVIGIGNLKSYSPSCANTFYRDVHISIAGV